MRIDSHYNPQAAAEANRSGTQSSAASNPSAGASAGEDVASLSGAQVQVEALAAQASQLPEVREQRVQSLRQAVQSGLYQPASKQVASALFTHMLQAQPA
jgi:negative regulator of flagellin synthesis FlgM